MVIRQIRQINFSLGFLSLESPFNVNCMGSGAGVAPAADPGRIHLRAEL
jgi:hypothetical protein